MDNYFFRNKRISNLCDYLKKRLSLEEIATEYVSDPHVEENPDYVEVLKRMENKERNLTLTYSSTVVYEADDENASEFERKKAGLDEQTVNEFLNSCTKTEEPTEWLTLILNKGREVGKGTIKMACLINIRMNIYSPDHHLIMNSEKLEDSSDVIALAEEQLKKYSL